MSGDEEENKNNVTNIELCINAIHRAMDCFEEARENMLCARVLLGSAKAPLVSVYTREKNNHSGRLAQLKVVRSWYAIEKGMDVVGVLVETDDSGK